MRRLHRSGKTIRAVHQNDKIRIFCEIFRNVLKKGKFSVTINELLLMCVEAMGNRSLMDRTPDSDSGNAGSIPAGCILR